MTKLTIEEWIKTGEKLFGNDKENWEVICSGCGRVQSSKTIREQMKKLIGSKRHGILIKGKLMKPFQECYSPKCNWVSYGLFNSNFKAGNSYVFQFNYVNKKLLRSSKK